MTVTTAATLQSPVPEGGSFAQSPARLLLGAIALALALQAGLVFLQPVNWDEFRYLSDVHIYRRGELAAWLQTLHVQPFFWLPDLPGNEVDQILAARTILFLGQVGTAALIYRCARAFMAREPALFALLCYLTCSYVLRHGASFRYDPIATLLLMGALALLLEAKVTRLKLASAGILAAVAGLVTIKAAFLLPTLAAALWWRASGARTAAARLVLVGGAAAAAFTLLAFLHIQSLAAPDVIGEQRIIGRGLSKTVMEAGLLPRADVLLRSFLTDPFMWAFMLAGLGFAVREFRAPGASQPRLVALLGLALPLATLIFYRNAFPYYYVLILAPACILAGYAAAPVERPPIYPIMAFLLAALAVFHAARAVSPALAVQRAHVDAVHSLFPSPVPYIDRSSMISSFPKIGFFMSSWGMENYLAARRPVVRDLLLAKAPVFVLANSPVLAEALTGSRPTGYRLRNADIATLRGNYVHHWGALWVAGKRFQATPEPIEFEILIPGAYTVEAAQPVLLDGVRRPARAVLRLSRGVHRIESPEGRQTVTLRHGVRLRIPENPPPPGPIFADL